ncbi:hypothetical protein D8S78_12380 [Natrialba swarupiae]|nr:hypothetical protein [Natrialba swarupiae]
MDESLHLILRFGVEPALSPTVSRSTKANVHVHGESRSLSYWRRNWAKGVLPATAAGRVVDGHRRDIDGRHYRRQ